MTSKPPEIIQVSPERAFLPVRLASTVDVGLVNAPVQINSVNLGPTRDRVLLAGQSTASANGIYVLTESGADTVRSITASQSTTETVTAARLCYVTVTGTVTVTGANGSVTEGNPGFLSPLSGPTRFDITGGAAGGTMTYKATVGLARATDADANGDFIANKLADVRQGSNAGRWDLQNPSGLVISNSLAITFIRTISAAQPAFNPSASRTSVAPTNRPIGYTFALVTSFGLLQSHLGNLHGLI